MRPCGLCGCSDRQGAYTVAIISIVDYVIHVIAISLALNRDIEPGVSDTELYAFLSSTILLLFLSILLFIGVRYDSKCLILPWLIMVLFADIGYLTATVAYFVLMVSSGSGDTKNVVNFLAALFHSLLVSYLLWVVLMFFIDLFSPTGRSGGYAGLNNEDDDDVESGRHHNHQRKPTIASKLLPRINTGE